MSKFTYLVIYGIGITYNATDKGTIQMGSDTRDDTSP